SWMERSLRQAAKCGNPPVATVYFHPWEFDPRQDRLPLGRLSRLRTYVGITTSRPRLEWLISHHRFTRAVDVADELRQRELQRFRLVSEFGARRLQSV